MAFTPAIKGQIRRIAKTTTPKRNSEPVVTLSAGAREKSNVEIWKVNAMIKATNPLATKDIAIRLLDLRTYVSGKPDIIRPIHPSALSTATEVTTRVPRSHPRPLPIMNMDSLKASHTRGRPGNGAQK